MVVVVWIVDRAADSIIQLRTKVGIDLSTYPHQLLNSLVLVG